MKTRSAHLIIVFVPTILWAQGNSGGLSGSVLDPTGAAVADVRVTLQNLANNARHTSSSSSAGYSFVALPPGIYRLETEKAGFKKFVRERVPVQTATVTTADIQLEVGAVTESVTVSGEVAALQTSSPEVGTSLDRKTILDLPIEIGGGASTVGASGRRTPENFIFLTPGVTGIPWAKQINGSPEFTQEVLFDGTSLQIPDRPGFVASFAPPYEAVEEFKVQTTLFPAEYGRGLGVINFTLRSGTNQFHGTAFEFFRNDKLDGRGFFNRVRPKVRFNEFGGSIGGPVIIPKLYNGRDKTFFNFNITGLRNRPASPGNLISLPPAAFREGDFSGFTDPAGAIIPVFDPATTLADGTRTPFAGNRIPAARFSSVARNSLGLIAQPDTPGYFNNFVNRQANRSSENPLSIKFDQMLPANQRLSFAYWDIINRWGFIGNAVSPLGEGGGPYGVWYFGQRGTGSRHYRVSYDHAIRPNLLHHFGFGYMTLIGGRTRDDRKGNETIRLPGVPADAPGFPTFTIQNNYGTLEVGNSNQQPTGNDWRLPVFIDNFTYIRGSHTFKFGADIRFYQQDNFIHIENGGISGTFAFTPLGTSSLTAANPANLGNGWASFLLGQVDNGQRLIPTTPFRLRNYNYNYFGEDTWKVTRKLTLTLGLRHEITPVVREADDRRSFLNRSMANPGAGGRAGALDFLRPGGSFLPVYKRALSPRLGAAYAINPKTVVRLGGGIFWSATNATVNGRQDRLFVAGFALPQLFAQLTSGREPAFLLDNGVPAFTGTLPSKDPALQNNSTIDYLNPFANKPGYVSSWTLNIQRELPGQFLTEIGYVGQRGVALPSGLENINQVPVSFLRLGNVLNADINSPQARDAGIPIPYAGFRGSVAQALRPYPQYANINHLYQPIGWNAYHSLQARIQRRYSNGLTVLGSYTLSKDIISQSSFTGFGDSFAAAGVRPIDTANYAIERRLAGFDQPHNLVLSWSYELPFGRSKRYLSGAGRAVDLVAGGWMLNGIHRYGSGTPLGAAGGPVLPLFGGGNRPNRLAGANARTAVSQSAFDPAIHRYLDIAAFSQPAPFTIGNSPPVFGNVRGFALLNEDFSVLKDFRVAEQHRAQLRVELFNLFNRVVFAGPAANLNAPAAFGLVAGQSNAPRKIQFVFKYMF